MDAKEYLDLHGSYELKQFLYEYSGNYDSHSDLISLMEGYAASKSYSPEVARRLIEVKKTAERYGVSWFVINDLNAIADSIHNNLGLDRWAEMERIAKVK